MEGRGESLSAFPALNRGFRIIGGNTVLSLKVQWAETRNGVGIPVLLGFPRVLVPGGTSRGDFQPQLVFSHPDS